MPYTLSMTTKPVAVSYERISDDREGTERGVERQREDNLDLAARHNADLSESHMFRDNDKGASTRSKKPRPAYKAMLERVRAGGVTYIFAYSNSRLTRRPMELEDLIKLHEETGVQIVTKVSGTDDLSTADGRMTARIKASVDAAEAERTAERVKRQHAARIKAGVPGGSVSAFGYMDDRVTLNPVEADALNHVADLILEGGSMSDGVRYLNDRGLMTHRGNRWAPSTLRATLRNARYCGRMAIWTGRATLTAVVDEAGNYQRGQWEPLMSEAKFDALQSVLDERAKAFKGGDRRARKYLLSGIARCGACGSALRGSPSRHAGSYNYKCPPASFGGCGGVSRDGARVDLIVSEAVKAVLESHLRGAHRAPEAWAGQAKLDGLESRLEAAFVEWEEGRLESAEYFKIRDRLSKSKRDLISERQAHEFETAEHARAVNADAEWGESLTRQREIVTDLVDAVVIEPLPVVDGRKVRGWNSDLVRILWRD